MERVRTLINKLQEQLDCQENIEKMAMTAHLILTELQQKQGVKPVGSRVSVVLPMFAAPKAEECRVVVAPKEQPAAQGWMFTAKAEVLTLANQNEPILKHNGGAALSKFAFSELNNSLAVRTESLNEKLKEDRVEIMSALQEAPVRDLKKAIGVNDRFLFVNDLFRGDEIMYERSLKTINSFNMYPEAQYWIQRELKVKLSWSDNSEAVRLFDQLVRRRFS